MFTLRNALERDCAALVTLDHSGDSKSQHQAFIERAVCASQCVVALDDPAIAGYGILDYSFFGYGFVALLYVAERFRQQGIGSLLLAHLETICTSPKLFTSTNLSNIRMQLLLRKQSYLLSGALQYLDDNDPELVYVKYLRIAEIAPLERT